MISDLNKGIRLQESDLRQPSPNIVSTEQQLGAAVRYARHRLFDLPLVVPQSSWVWDPAKGDYVWVDDDRSDDNPADKEPKK